MTPPADRRGCSGIRIELAAGHNGKISDGEVYRSTANDASVFNGMYSDNEVGATWQTGDLDFDGIWSSNDASFFNGLYDESLPQL